MTRENARIKVEQLDYYLSHACQDYGERDHEAMMMAIKALEQEPTIQERQAESDRWQKAFDDGYQNGYSQASFDCRQDLDKIRAEILDCLKALDEIEKSGFNIYLPNEMSGRRLTYQQCLEFIAKYKAETEK